MSNTIDMSALDVDMNSVEELKGFELPPEGSYTCTLSLSPKAINGETRLEWKFDVVEPIELNDPDAVVPAGATFNLLMGLRPIKTKDGKDFDPKAVFKVKCTILSEALGVANNPRELVEAVQNVQVNCFLKHKLTNGKVYAEVPDAGFEVA